MRRKSFVLWAELLVIVMLCLGTSLWTPNPSSVRAGPVSPDTLVDSTQALASFPSTSVPSLPAAFASAALITITATGFQPPLLTTTVGTPVVWRNATGASHTLQSGEPNRLYLPLIVRSATGSSLEPGVTSVRPPDTRAPRNGSLFNATLAPGGLFTYTFNTPGAYAYFLATAPQFVGVVVVQPGIPPDPSTIAPPIDLSVATNLCAATQFVYASSTPIQTGVVSGTIECRRAAVLRGKVLNRDGSPLAGVGITALNHPEWGQTLSRNDGMFDLAVNGGGLLIVSYAKEGYLPAQRHLNVPWQDYAWLPPVRLITADPNVTTIDLTSSAMQVARGSTIADADGSRRATLLFPFGTQATMVFPNGTTQPLTPTLHVHATEYTVGPNGPATMPAELPPTSGYTYATEFTVDQAVAAGAKRVRFTPSLISYNENFLNLPVGIVVPVGSYDRDRGTWLANDNGRVIKILSISGGLANLDIDGSGTPASAAALAALGVTDAERQQLASLYSAGQSLWRVPISHFSPWDYNYPYGPPAGARGAGQPPASNRPVDCPQRRTGSTIECQNQILGESVGINGSPFRLHYSSERVPGNQAANTLKIPVSGMSVPVSLKRIDLEIKVAGQLFTPTLPAAANQTYSFTWNSQDAYGRTLQGSQPVNVRIGYVYDAIYQQPAQFQQSFAATTGVPITANRARQELTLWQEYNTLVSSPVKLRG